MILLDIFLYSNKFHILNVSYVTIIKLNEKEIEQPRPDKYDQQVQHRFQNFPFASAVLGICIQVTGPQTKLIFSII